MTSGRLACPVDLYEEDPDNPGGRQRATEEPKFAVTKHLAGMYKKCDDSIHLAERWSSCHPKTLIVVQMNHLPVKLLCCMDWQLYPMAVQFL